MRYVYSTWLHACHTVGVQCTVSLTQVTRDRVGERWNTKGRKGGGVRGKEGRMEGKRDREGGKGRRERKETKEC